MGTFQDGAFEALVRRDETDKLLGATRRRMRQALEAVEGLNLGLAETMKVPAAMALIMLRFRFPGRTITKAMLLERIAETYPTEQED